MFPWNVESVKPVPKLNELFSQQGVVGGARRGLEGTRGNDGVARTSNGVAADGNVKRNRTEDVSRGQHSRGRGRYRGGSHHHHQHHHRGGKGNKTRGDDTDAEIPLKYASQIQAVKDGKDAEKWIAERRARFPRLGVVRASREAKDNGSGSLFEPVLASGSEPPPRTSGKSSSTTTPQERHYETRILLECLFHVMGKLS